MYYLIKIFYQLSHLRETKLSPHSDVKLQNWHHAPIDKIYDQGMYFKIIVYSITLQSVIIFYIMLLLQLYFSKTILLILSCTQKRQIIIKKSPVYYVIQHS